MSRRHGSALILVAVLALCILILARELRVDSDLSLFLPRTEDPVADLLVGELREGTTARSLLLAISGGPAEQLAEASRELLANLARDRRLRRIDNGSQGLDPELRDWLMVQRYLLVPLAPHALSAENLRLELHRRLAELAGNTALLRPTEVLRDPTAASLAALHRLAPVVSPERRNGVWMSLDGQRALLFAELAHGGFAIDQQQALLAHIRAQFDGLASPSLRLELSGPAAFAVDARESIVVESRKLSLLAGLGVGLILWLSYRSARLILLATVPAASGVLVAVTVVTVLFGSIHGITLAFGVTVLGVAMDYPIHLFSHMARAANSGYGHIWPTLGVGLLTTSLGYCVLLLSDFSGLAQLGVFAISGLCAAAAVTRWMLPHWLAQSTAVCTGAERLGTVVKTSRAARSLLWLASIGLLLAVILDQRPWLESDIAALSPVPTASKEMDRELRAALGASEASHLIYVSGESVQTVLERQEQLLPLLQSGRGQALFDGFEAAAYLLPSIATQAQRVARLPSSDTLRAALAEAMRGLPLDPSRFEPFIADVEASRNQPPLLPGAANSAPLDIRLASLLKKRGVTWFGPIFLIGLKNPGALESQVNALELDGVYFLDLHAASSRMLDRFMSETLSQAAWLALLIAATLLLTQRDGGLRISAAVLLSLGGDVALLHLAGETLSIFHIIGLLLVLGIGLDYGLFRARTPATGQAGTRHALRTCWLSTLMVFALLSSSEVPVLHALGSTVAIGVSLCYLVSAVLVAPARS